MTLQTEEESVTIVERREALRSVAREIAEKEELPELAEWLEVEGEETLSCFRFPSTHRLRIRTTNGMERLNQEIKRRRRWGRRRGVFSAGRGRRR